MILNGFKKIIFQNRYVALEILDNSLQEDKKVIGAYEYHSKKWDKEL